MIVSKITKIKISSSNYKWYVEKNYGPFNKGDIIDVDVEDLTHGSSGRVDVQCEKCKSINNIQFNNYNNQLKKHNFYVCQKCNFEKAKKTNKIKYGCISPLTNADVKEKSKQTMIKKYGVDNISKVDFIREDRSESMKKNTKDYNDIIINKYGCNVSKLDWIKEKKRETTLKHWGVDNPSQNVELFEKSQKSGKKIKLHEIGLWYRGTYEKDFLDYCLVNKIEVKKGPTIKFNYNNKNKYYHSDYFIPEKNLIIEIKSYYYYHKFKELNDIKREETIKNGYNHIFIIDKDYTHF